VEIELFHDGGQIKIKTNVDHHSHFPQADPFSLVPTFKVKYGRNHSIFLNMVFYQQVLDFTSPFQTFMLYIKIMNFVEITGP
jgi:hypothetical protein